MLKKKNKYIIFTNQKKEKKLSLVTLKVKNKIFNYVNIMKFNFIGLSIDGHLTCMSK